MPAAGPTSAAPDPDAGPISPLRRLSGAVRQPGLVRNAGLIAGNTVIGAAFGFLFTAALTRLYPTRDVGLITTAASASLLIASLSALGTNYAVVRFLHGAPDRGRLVSSVAAAIGSAAVVAGLVLLAIPEVTGRLRGLSPALFPVVFVLANLITVLKGLGDNVFIALRRAEVVVSTNLVAQSVRLALLFALLPLGPIGAYAALPLGLAVGLVLVLRRLRADRDWRWSKPSLTSLTPMLRFAGGSYVSSLVGGLPGLLLPLIALSRFGSEQAAYWNIAMLIGTLLFSIPSAIGQSMFAEGATDPQNVRALARRAAHTLALVIVPVTGVAIAVTPLVLATFGSDYADQAAAPLRLLLLSALLVSANYVAGTILFLAQRVALIVAINAANAAVVLFGSLVIADGLTGLAGAWIAGEVLNVALFVEFARRELRRPAAGAGP